MIDSSQAHFSSLSIHYIGNKTADTPLILSDAAIDLSDPHLRDGLVRYFFSHFTRPEFYRFVHSDQVGLNTVYNICGRIFEPRSDHHELSLSLARYLYEKSIHPQVKAGELYVAHMRDCLLEGEPVDVIGIFKTESKSRFFKVGQDGSHFRLEQDYGMSEEKMDKGCLVFKTDKEDGYRVCIVDNVNKGDEAHYWRSDFLGLSPCNDDYHKTSNFLTLCKSFIKEQMPEEFVVEKTAQIDMLNKTVDFFKKHERFDFQEFSTEVMQEPMLMQSFERYKEGYEQEQQTTIEGSFDISGMAVRKQERVFKSVLKLDKNFHVYIHGDRQLIEKGYDEEKGMNYYKIYYREES